jgi:AcrR family transcriptional regulator
VIRVAGTNGSDPTVPDRILTAATRVYGQRGRVATLDDVAEAAGVSRAHLDRHFESELALREAIDERLMAVAGRVFADAPAGDSEDFSDLALRVTSMVRDHFDEMRYVARTTVDGEPDGLAMFDAFMAIALSSFEELASNGALDPDLDVEWAALHVVVFNLAVVLFGDAIANHLPEGLTERAGVERWHAADTEVFRRGFLRRPEENPALGRAPG